MLGDSSARRRDVMRASFCEKSGQQEVLAAEKRSIRYCGTKLAQVVYSYAVLYKYLLVSTYVLRSKYSYSTVQVLVQLVLV